MGGIPPNPLLSPFPLICLTAYAVGMLRHLPSPLPLQGSSETKHGSNPAIPITYVEPLPAHLKISPDFITYSAQDATPAVGGAAAARLKVARLRELDQGRSQVGGVKTGKKASTGAEMIVCNVYHQNLYMFTVSFRTYIFNPRLPLPHPRLPQHRRPQQRQPPAL